VVHYTQVGWICQALFSIFSILFLMALFGQPSCEQKKIWEIWWYFYEMAARDKRTSGL